VAERTIAGGALGATVGALIGTAFRVTGPVLGSNHASGAGYKVKRRSDNADQQNMYATGVLLKQRTRATLRFVLPMCMAAGTIAKRFLSASPGAPQKAGNRYGDVSMSGIYAVATFF